MNKIHILSGKLKKFRKVNDVFITYSAMYIWIKLLSSLKISIF